jgi:hypothetical protein
VNDVAAAAVDDDDNAAAIDVAAAAIKEYYLWCQKRRQRIATIDGMVDMYHFDMYMNKSEYKVPTESRYGWVMKTLGNRTYCYNMLMMNKNMFNKLCICLWSHMD